MCKFYIENKCIPAHNFMNLSCTENHSVLGLFLLLILKFIKPVLENFAIMYKSKVSKHPFTNLWITLEERTSVTELLG